MDFLDFDTSKLIGTTASTSSSSSQDIFSIFQGLENVSSEFSFNETSCLNDVNDSFGPKCKRQKISATGPFVELGQQQQQQQKMAHVNVERNRRKQMNEHLSILRSLMPGFYVKRGDQASIIGGVVTYITELQQVLQSLEAKKQRKLYSEVLSPKNMSSSPLISPLKPPISPRINLPISPRTPQSNNNNCNKNMPKLMQQTAAGTTGYVSSSSSPISSTTSSMESCVNELVVNSKSAIAEVEVKFMGSNVLLQAVSPRIPGQAFKIISVLESLNLEILQVNISTVDETMLASFTIKIGIDCELSADELAQLIQHTFC